jgi:hypothetical protein
VLCFIIERRHPDGILFQLVGESTVAVYTDASALPGIAYRYRVRAKSAWCRSEPGLAAVLPLEAEDEDAWQVRPTLTEGPLRITTTRREQGLVRIQLYDLLGSLVWAAAPWKPEGAWTYELDLGPFPAGLYILRLRFGGEERVVRVMKAG